MLVDILLGLAALPVALASAYLLLLTLLSGRKRAPAPGPPHHRFVAVVPAHDEEAGISATVKSLLSLDYPAELRRVVVVADNCRDSTAQRAREAGADVLVRVDPERRGKGYALALAFQQFLADGFADAMVVIDADTVVSANLLRAFAARLDEGAGAIQAYYGVRNPEASWRTRTAALAFALFHRLRSLGRERLGCSSGLRGNGMCFTRGLLEQVPHDAFSVVEDLEYGIRLALAGHRVRYADEAEVLGEMPAGAGASRSQRQRWEGGRLQMARRHAPTLLRRGLAARDPVLVDMALDLLVPPLAYLTAIAVAGFAGSALASGLAARPLVAPWIWGACLAALGLYVMRGWWLSGLGLRGLEVLFRAPAFLAWKLGLALVRPRGSRGEWVRTPREPRS